MPDAPVYRVRRQVVIDFAHDVTMAENLDAADALVNSKIEMLLNTARREAEQQGIQMRVAMGMSYERP